MANMGRGQEAAERIVEKQRRQKKKKKKYRVVGTRGKRWVKKGEKYRAKVDRRHFFNIFGALAAPF